MTEDTANESLASAEGADSSSAEPERPDSSDTETQTDGGWEPFDTVLQAFGAERGVGVGTLLSDPEAPELQGRFASWANSSSWRCSLQLLRAPAENVVVLVAQGPPLPGGRARMMVLGAFPPEFEQDTLRAALEVGHGIGETWGPSEEPSAAAEPPTDEATL